MQAGNQARALSRRTFLKTSALGLAAVGLAACAPAGAPTSGGTAAEGQAAPSGEVVQLRLSAWADVQDAVVYENMTKAWHETQDTARATVEQYPGGYYEKVQANFAAGDSADILYFQGWSWQAYAENAVIAPLNEWIERDDASAFFPTNENYNNTTLWKGNTYMTPTDTGSLVVFYNKKLFDQKGIPYPQAGWTWEDFQQIIMDLSFDEGSTHYYGWAQAAGWNGGYGRTTNFMRRNGHIEWDSIVEPKEARWDHEDIASALQFLIYDAIANGWSPGPEVIAGGGVGVDTGRVAMVLEGPWHIPRLWGELATSPEGIEFDVVEPPVGSAERDFSFGHVHGHVITQPSEKKEASWDLIKFILGDDGQNIIANGGRMCGTPDNIDKIWGPIASKTYNFTNTGAFANGMRNGSTPLIMGEGAQISAYGGAPITSLWDKLLGQQENAAEALKIANEEIQRELDNYWRERA
ncbi:MAG: extracellular solute-binding protein [Caldilineaceae bacterium]|nr:extracellular solute-binding protein [Caldilineaceae bacterium]